MVPNGLKALANGGNSPSSESLATVMRKKALEIQRRLTFSCFKLV